MKGKANNETKVNLVISTLEIRSDSRSKLYMFDRNGKLNLPG